MDDARAAARDAKQRHYVGESCAACGHSRKRVKDARCVECERRCRPKAMEAQRAKAGLPCEKCGFSERYVSGRCIPCARETYRRHELQPGRAQAKRKRHLKKRYGITPEQFNLLLETQGGCCAVCGGDDPKARDWHIDHCHKTGATRGLLCSTCNTGIGGLQDSADLLRRAIEYLDGDVQHARIFAMREIEWASNALDLGATS